MEANSSGEDCCVKVAVHVRPLIGDERLQGCKDCVTIVPGKPQIQIGTHSFTFDQVYGSNGSLSTSMYEDCVAPLVDGLFQGYNATVLAYGQTGSGKTYTMGTSLRDGSQGGIIPKVMNALFSKIETLKHEIEFQLHVSFIEIHKEEVRDLLDPEYSTNKQETANGHAAKVASPGKAPIQIRETSSGVITLAGSTECSVKTLKEMADCLEQGSLSRATGSTNMNNQSSRSHAIFTITMEQMRRVHPGFGSDGNLNDCMSEEYLSAKLHLVDLAGSERAKRTGSDGLRFKEEFIGWLDDQINRDPISSEMLKMRQQLEYLQAELCARGGGVSFDEIQVLKNRITWLEATNEELSKELNLFRNGSDCMKQHEAEIKAYEGGAIKGEGLKRGLQSMESSDYKMSEGDSGDIDEDTAKELEHTYLQNSMDQEMSELNRQLEQKESQMKLFGGYDTTALKQHFGKKLMELEEEKKTVQRERDRLLAEVENLSANSDGQAQKLQDMHAHKLKTLEAQIQDLKKKQENQVQLLKQKQKSDEAARKLQEEIQCIKAQKVQLHQKIKQEAEQFRQWKASREKELLQLRKEGRRNEYERHKLQALNQRQKMVLQRKTEEAALATKRLKELLEARKSSTRDNSVISNGIGTNGQGNEKSLQRWLDHELEVMVNVHEVRFEYEKQSQVRSALADELAVLRQVDEFASRGVSPPRGKNGVSRCELWEKEMEINEMKEQMKEVVGVLRQSELRRKEVEKELKYRDKAAPIAPATPPQVNSHKHNADDTSDPLSPIPVPAQKQLKYTAGIANGSVRDSAAFMDQTRKMVPIGQLSMKKLSLASHGGKLWRWKRSHHQWLLQFKWKWQKPWRLSEWIKHSDETIMRAKSRPQALPNVMYRKGR
ncbi:kinesin-like protein [Striga asiatica]|uniref:Kinesin-like protein n=1 Tax=Striga asiatica TaxID=4170 RepID=A0A5A7Q4R2_STRAF|nr:kinesin-like protein [Striga asiatica]